MSDLMNTFRGFFPSSFHASGLITAFMFLICLAAAQSASAATITVNSAADTFTNGDGQCTLRKALANANENYRVFTDCVVGSSGADTIIFTAALANRTITLGTELGIKDHLTINAQSAPGLSVSGNNRTRVFRIFPSTVVMNGFRITGGNEVGTIGIGGGGIFNNGNLTLNNMVIEGNTVNGLGGGVYTSPARSLTINGGSIRGNTANQGGAIYGENGTTPTPIAIILTNVTVSGNVAGGSGGGIYATGGTIDITGGSVTGNTATNQDGGGIASMVTVVNVTNSSITNNHADGSGGDGGGIYNDSGRSTITNSTISGNTTQGSGGGFFANKGLHNIIGTTLSGNSARSSATTSSRRGGGGLAVVGQGTVNIANATVSGNSSDCLCGGGGISTVDGTVTTLRNVTVANNSASAGPGGGITTEVPIAYLTTTNIGNTIIADNTATTDPDVNGRIVSQGFNLVRNRGASTGYVASDLPNGSNPSLQALGNYGGPTQTHQLLVGSAAIDRGSNALAVDPSNNTALATDQRGAGFARIRDGNLDGAAIVDIGAFEVQTGTLPPADLTVVKSHTGNFAQRDTGKTYSITVTNSGRTATSGTVTVKDTLPTGLSATAISGAGWTCTLATLTCTRSDSLAASASYPAITLTVNVAANAPSSVTNTATVSGGGETNTTNNTAADPTTINAAATYSISGQVTNGGTALQGVTVSLGSALTATTVTNALGQYSFSNLASGVNYTVTSALNGYTFAPVSTAVNNLTMNQTSVNFATSTTTYEGDVATRPTGDGAVDIFDLVAVGRIIALLDPAPANGSELQRADVAPRLNGFASLARGDGAVDVLDMVQIGRYSAVLDARTQAGGPIAPAPAANQLIGNYTDQKDGGGEAASASAESAEGQAAVMAPTALSAGSVTVSSTTAVVPIQLTTTGDTQALQFSITYDQTKLAVPADLAVAFTNRYPNTTFIFNTATAGRIGVVAYQPIDGTSVFPAGAVTLFNIKFTLVGTPSGTATIDFSDTPVPRRASTPAAAAVAVTSAPGTVTFLAPTAASVSISGRVTTASGRGIVNVRLTLTDSNGQIRTARTTSFGYYRFDAVQAGETYILSAIGKRYTFSQPVQVLNVNEETDAVNFIADSEKRRIVF